MTGVPRVTRRYLPLNPREAFEEGRPLFGWRSAALDLDNDKELCKRAVVLGMALDMLTYDDYLMPYVFGYKPDGLLALVGEELLPNGRYATED